MGKERRVFNDDALQLIAGRFQAMSEPMRLKLILALEAGERCVGELVEVTGGNQANISRHLQTLAGAGIVARRKEGLQVYYRIADPTIFGLCEHVCGSLALELQRRQSALQGTGSEAAH